MRYRVSHTTIFEYAGAVTHCLSEARLIPRPLPFQEVLSTELTIVPHPATLEHREDYFGNRTSTFSILEQHNRLEVKAVSMVDVQPLTPEPPRSVSCEEARAHISQHVSDESMSAYEFVFDSPFVEASPQLAGYGAAVLKPGTPLTEAVMQLSHRIHQDFAYAPKTTAIDMPLAEVLRRRQGVCQDFTHVMIGVLRSYGLAARYVSGYLRSGARYTGAEASHAWVSVFVPGYGWLDLDPTNDVIPSGGHVTVAWGRDYGDVTPVKGISLGGGAQTVRVAVGVVPAGAEGLTPDNL
jgi:transglutaminase-like putative cysteine protease